MSDLIDRQAILKHIEKIRQDALMMDDIRESNIIMMGMNLCEEALKNQPSAQPERKTGRWEMKSDPYGFFDEIPVCSECGCTTKWREKYLYCPNCGASMARGEEDE